MKPKSAKPKNNLIIEEELHQMNKSELVQLCRDAGVRANRSVSTLDLIHILKTPAEEHKLNNPIDLLRDEVMNFLTSEMEHEKSQLKLGCDGNCYNHSDMQILLCWITNRETIKRFS